MRPQGFDVLAIDAFSSDSIPVHLITREALALYLRHMKPGGVIVYAVCSLFEREGAGQIEAFMQRHTGFRAEGILPDTGRPSGAGRLLTPFHDATDGFFVARLARSC